jgi:single-strand DNA-binding protein
MHYVLDGVVLEIGKIEKFASGFQKREIIIRNEDDFTQDIKVEFVNDNCEKLDLFKTGEVVMVAFTLVGNQYQGKYYTNLRGIAIGQRVIENGEKKGKSKAKKEKKVTKSDDDLEF